MHTTVIKAIKNRLLLEFEYDGHYRLVESHTYGTFKTGKDTLVAYQIDGTSERGNVPDWRPFTVSKITNLVLLEDSFTGTRNGYKRGDSRMDEIYAEL
jgi:hypothetical protein